MRKDIPAHERLIVALDVDWDYEATAIVRELGDAVSFYKIGLQLFMQFGMDIVTAITGLNKDVFLDLKIDDTPRTVKAAVTRAASTARVKFLTLNGNGDTAQAAIEMRGSREFPKFLQVTYLSSWNSDDLKDHLHIPKEEAINFDKSVIDRTRRILDAGCEGVIASGSSVAKLRNAYPEIIIVAPGIRPEGSEPDDHKRTLTPREAILAGADYLVVGRPIRNSNDPRRTALNISEEIQRALDESAKPAPAEQTAKATGKVRFAEASAG